MRKNLLLFIILSWTCHSLHSQKKDTLYRYDLCVHQKARNGKVSSTNVQQIGDSNNGIHIELWDDEREKVESSIVTLTNSINDSVIKVVRLDTSNTYDFINLIPGDYDINVQNILFARQKITNVKLSNNSFLKLDFELGQPDEYVYISIKSSKKLSSRQLKKRIKDIEARLNK